MIFNRASYSKKESSSKFNAGSTSRNLQYNRSYSSRILSIPFISGLRFIARRKQQSPDLMNKKSEEKRILWFTDTLNDLNGPSVTLKKLGWLSYKKEIKLALASSLSDEEMNSEIPPNLINLPYIFSFKLPYYNKYLLKIPSLLKSLKVIKQYAPTEIYISTPGTVGLLALMAANILKIKKVGIYHTDFYLQSRAVVNNKFIPVILERLMKWFYSSMDEIRVPTVEYMSILESRGYDRSRMKIFRRGIDSNLFSMKDNGKSVLKEKFNIKDGITLLFTGRISKDKNLDFLLEVYKKLIEKKYDINLMLVGDGPDLDNIKEKTKNYKRVYLTGKIDQIKLPEIYSGADIFVFTSIADTFGMSVLEAQACGLPAVVSDSGGPKEIAIDCLTGFIAKSNNHEDWIEKIEKLIALRTSNYNAYQIFRERSRANIIENYNWESVLSELIGAEELIPDRKTHIA